MLPFLLVIFIGKPSARAISGLLGGDLHFYELFGYGFTMFGMVLATGLGVFVMLIRFIYLVLTAREPEQYHD